MKGPRYTVGTVTGWPITPSTINGGPRYQRTKPSTIAYVFDSAYCYRAVARFDGREGGLEAAERHAAKLNELDRKLNR